MNRKYIYNWLLRYKYHFYFWPPFLLFLIILDYIQYPEYTFIQRELYMAFLQLCIFYSSLFVVKKFKRTTFRNWIISIARLLLSFGFILFLNHWRGKLAALFGYKIHETFYILLLDTIRVYWGLAVYALGYYYLTRYGTKQKELRQLAEAKAAQDVAAAQLATQNAQMKQEMLELENNFLRAQINPHFLYNTLNTFYARAMSSDPALAESIVNLSEIMRYSLETTQGAQLVPLQSEVRHLKRVIGMHQLRSSDKLQINFTTEGQYGQVQVAPLIFVTLLENALKHGDVTNPDEPVTLWLAVDATHIYFTIRNSISNKPKEHSHGIGLENIKKRLQHVYGNRYRFGVETKEDQYHVILAIEYE
jgi:two-component system, LytTR family, sensor kinase